MHTLENKSFISSRAFKLSLLWTLFTFASLGTYFLSHRVEYRGSNGSNAAAAFLANGSSKEIDLYADKADPSSVEIRTGDQVIFAVKDDSHHNIAEERTQRISARLESGEIGEDESYSLVFKDPGTYYFYDRLNQDIHVTVTIK